MLGWGNFLTVAINFAIIAWILFLLVKGMNRLRRNEDAKTGTADKPAEIPADVKLLTEIRDLLKTGRTRLNASPVSIEPFVFCHGHIRGLP